MRTPTADRRTQRMEALRHLEEGLAHELMGDDGRQELRDRALRLRRKRDLDFE
jgi:hypothetical protein